MPQIHPLDDVQMTQIADRFRILGEVNRLKIIASLAEGERSVSDLVARTGASQANVSRHLAALRQSGIVKRRKVGTWVYYAIADPTVFTLCECVCGSLGILKPAPGAPVAG